MRDESCSGMAHSCTIRERVDLSSTGDVNALNAEPAEPMCGSACTASRRDFGSQLVDVVCTVRIIFNVNLFCRLQRSSDREDLAAQRLMGHDQVRLRLLDQPGAKATVPQLSVPAWAV